MPNQTSSVRYPGRTDTEKMNYSINLAAKLVANPSTYGVGSTSANVFQTLVSSYATALSPCTGPDATHTLRVTKDGVKKNMLEQQRLIRSVISAACVAATYVSPTTHPTVADLQGLGMGVPGGVNPSVYKQPRKKAVPPSHGPGIKGLHWEDGYFWVAISSSPNNTSMAQNKAKPKNVKATIFEYRYKLPNPTGWIPYTPYSTRSPFPMMFPSEVMGASLEIRARYQSTRGQVSGFGNTINTVVTNVF